jgi:hypothetical protein
MPRKRNDDSDIDEINSDNDNAVNEPKNVIDFEAVHSLLDSGASPKAIAKQFNLKVEDISACIGEHYSNMYNTDKVDPRETLVKQLNSCRTLFELAKVTYLSAPNSYNADAVTKLASTIQSTLKDINNLSNNESKVEEIVESIIKPTIRDAIKFMGENITNVIDKVGYNKELKNELTLMSKNFGEQLTSIYKNSLNKLGEIFDCEFNLDSGSSNKEEENDNENNEPVSYQA